jgi:hypothetical protein
MGRYVERERKRERKKERKKERERIHYYTNTYSQIIMLDENFS